MQPAAADVVQYFTLPASAATAGDFFVAMMSLPWWRPCPRGAPKSLVYATSPTTGKMSRGTFPRAAPAAAEATARPSIAARKKKPRAVVRWRLIRERGHSGARPKGRRLAAASAEVISDVFGAAVPRTCGKVR